jgi:hypothetical protein
LLPQLAKLQAGSDATADEASLQRASDLVAPDQVCPAGNTFCTSAVSTVEGRIYAIYPASRPQISAPLGWVLSSVSREAIAAALDQQEATSCTASENSAVSHAGTAPFAIERGTQADAPKASGVLLCILARMYLWTLPALR